MALPDSEVLAILAQIADRHATAEAAFRTLYLAYARDVHAYAWNKLRRAEEAEEVVVETMHEVWRSAHRFRGESAFKTWLLGIAKHKVLDRWRAADPEHDDVDELADVIADDGPDAFAQLAQADRSAGVQRCLQRLSAEHRECLHLVYFQEMGLREIAALQAVPEGTVKTRLFHARQRIKDCLRALLLSEGAHGAA